MLRKKSKNTLFTTPSHGQKFFIFNKFCQFYKYDISETNTHDPSSALLKAQNHAAKIYGTKHTIFLTNGSTSGIIASVLSCTKPGDKILIHENAHQSHANAVRLAGCEPIFYTLSVDEKWGVFGKNSASNIEPYFKNNKIKAVIITSPTYEGFVSDIREIQSLCKRYGAYLITDEAHGALYPFSNELPESAVQISDFTIQSLHKTAGGLNPTALLHSNCEVDPSNALSIINTTSPSYPLLATIEVNIKYLNSQKCRKKIKNLINNIKDLKSQLPNLEFGGDDITKILVKAPNLTGEDLSEKLYEYGIEDERSNQKSVMLLCGLGTDEKKLEQLKKVLRKL